VTPAGCWSSCQLAEHVEEVRRRQTEVVRLLPWLIADPLLVEALELMVTELIEHHDGLHDEDVLVRVIEG
jgi:bacteriorhodopsin